MTSKFRNDPSFENRSGVRVHHIPIIKVKENYCPLHILSFFFAALLKTFKLNREEGYDIIHAQFLLPAGGVPYLLGIPYMVTCRGSDVPGHSGQLKDLHKIIRPLQAAVLENARKVVALSNSLKSSIKSVYPNIKVKVINDGSDISRFVYKERQGDRSFTILTVSRLVEEKGIQFLLTALSKLESDFNLRVVGDGEVKGNLESLARKSGIADKVSFEGHLEGDALVDAYETADLFVLPSLSESFGLVAVEAMATGLPVVATRVGGIPGIVDENTGILVEPGNPIELRKAIAKLESDPELRARMGRLGRRKAEKMFSWQRVADEYISLYESSLE